MFLLACRKINTSIQENTTKPIPYATYPFASPNLYTAKDSMIAKTTPGTPPNAAVYLRLLESTVRVPELDDSSLS